MTNPGYEDRLLMELIHLNGHLKDIVYYLKILAEKDKEKGREPYPLNQAGE